MSFFPRLAAIIAVLGATVAIVFLLASLRVPAPAQPAGEPGPNPMGTTSTSAAATSSALFNYIEVIDGCGPYFGGTCVNMRSGPATSSPSIAKLRNGMVLKVAETVTNQEGTWYKIGFDDSIRYPERVTGDWYVAADYVRLFTDAGDIVSWKNVLAQNNKRIVIDLSEETLYAYEGDAVFMQEFISTGLDATPTPRGTFRIYKKTPSRYMQGPLPGVSGQYYDLPGVPWNLYFTLDGAVIHGAYWHDHFGHQWSHGCVNLPPEKAHVLYDWADINTKVTVQD